MGSNERCPRMLSWESQLLWSKLGDANLSEPPSPCAYGAQPQLTACGVRRSGRSEPLGQQAACFYNLLCEHIHLN